jgi:multiple sugar transport system permease protein
VDWLKEARGLFQLIFQAFGSNIPSRLWYLRGPSVAWMAIMFQNIFTTVPTFMIMFLAALQDIPRSLYEAASLDGATGWHQFWKVTLPLLRPVMVLVVVLGTIGTWQIFDQVKILTSGGPLGTTLVPVYLIYTEGIGTQGPPRMGLASAMAFILAVIILIFTLIQRRVIERGTEMYY